MYRQTLTKIFKDNLRYYSLKVNETQKSASSDTGEYIKKIKDKEDKSNEKFPGWDDALPFSKIPGDVSLPFVGSIWKMLPIIGKYYGKSVIDISTSIHSEYGDISRLSSLFGENSVLLFNPHDFEILFRNEGIWPIRRTFAGFEYYRKVLKADIFKGVGGAAVSNGKEWHDFRTTVNPIMMQPRVIRPYVGQMDEVANELVENMKFYAEENPNKEMRDNFIEELFKWSLESVAVVALDARLGVLKRDLDPNSDALRLIAAAVDMFKLEFQLEFLPSLWRLTGMKTRTWKKFLKVMDELTYSSLKYVNEAMERIDNKQYSESEHQISVLEKLLKIDKSIAIAMAMDMLMAGIETTGRSLAAVLYYLARYPEKQDQLRKELIKFLPNPNSPITEEILAKTPYLKAVIRETMRISPVLQGNARTTTKDIVLSGYQIPKGTEVITSNLIISNDERYVPRAKEFIPERWLRDTEGELLYKNLHPFITLPFGFGARSCLGKRIANLELETTIAKIVRNFDMSWPHKDMTFTMVLFYSMNDPLKIRVNTITK